MAGPLPDMHIHCLHGTFQSPSVWDAPGREVTRRLAAEGRSARITTHGIEPGNAADPAAWAAAWLRRLPDDPDASQVLLGYSLGGRLALHALLQAPGRWLAAILVAAHPGEPGESARRRIVRRDAAWAARCRDEPWESLLADWDALPVFGGRPNAAPRDPEALDRATWSAAFERLSRGRQDDLRPALAAAAADGRLPPVLYLTGDADAKYTAIGEELAAFVPRIEHVVIPGAVHRVPWENTAGFAAAAARFLSPLVSGRVG